MGWILAVAAVAAVVYLGTKGSGPSGSPEGGPYEIPGGYYDDAGADWSGSYPGGGAGVPPPGAPALPPPSGASSNAGPASGFTSTGKPAGPDVGSADIRNVKVPAAPRGLRGPLEMRRHAASKAPTLYSSGKVTMPGTIGEALGRGGGGGELPDPTDGPGWDALFASRPAFARTLQSYGRAVHPLLFGFNRKDPRLMGLIAPLWLGLTAAEQRSALDLFRRHAADASDPRGGRLLTALELLPVLRSALPRSKPGEVPISVLGRIVLAPMSATEVPRLVAAYLDSVERGERSPEEKAAAGQV